MRQIKFRQPIRTKAGVFTQWFYWGYIDGQWIEPAIHLSGIDTRTESQQFIGLLDRNGKEIFEGDILEDVDRRRGVIEMGIYEMDNRGGGFCQWGTKGRSLYVTKTMQAYEVEVIGNIHEHPELFSS